MHVRHVVTASAKVLPLIVQCTGSIIASSAMHEQLADRSNEGALKSAILPSIALLLTAPSQLVHILLYSTHMRCKGSFSSEISTAELSIKLPVDKREAFTRQHAVGLHSCVCAAIASATLQANQPTAGQNAADHSRKPWIGGLAMLLAALLLGVVSSVRAFDSATKYSASVAAIAIGTFYSTMGGHDVAMRLFTPLEGMAGIAAMHLLKQYPEGFALLSTAAVIVSEHDDGKPETTWQHGLFASDLQQPTVGIARQFSAQLEHCMQWRISSMLHNCAREKRTSWALRVISALQRRARTTMNLRMPLGFVCLRIPQDGMDTWSRSSQHALGDSPVTISYCVEGDEVRLKCRSHFPADSVLEVVQRELLTLY